jgi:hypothetical protein
LFDKTSEKALPTVCGIKPIKERDSNGTTEPKTQIKKINI